MSRIVVRPDQLRTLSAQLSRAAGEISDVGGRVGHVLGGLNWEVRQRVNVEGMVNQARSRANALASQAMEMARYLERKAQAFEEADGQGVSGLEQIVNSIGERILGPMPWLPFRPQAGLLQGLALGVSTGVQFLPVRRSITPEEPETAQQPQQQSQQPPEFRAEYERMSWGQRFKEEERIRRELAGIPGEVAHLEEVNGTLRQQEENIARRIAELERRKSEVEERSRNPVNKILPDTPFQWGSDDEGIDAPWRTQSDRYEDEAQRIEQEIYQLKQQQDEIQERIRQNVERIEGLRDVERDLQNRQQEIERIVNRGVKPDGPTNKWLRGQLAGCTNYVAQKRDVNPWPNPSGQPGHPRDARYWDDQARQAGYETGTRPVKGSIMVFERGVLGVDRHYGHVAYVERVEQHGNGFIVTTSEANAVRRGREYIRGTHTPVRNRTYYYEPQPDGSYKVWRATGSGRRVGRPVTVSRPGKSLTFIYDRRRHGRR